MAAMVCAPTVSEEVLVLAVLLVVTVTGPPKLEPSTVNWTVPVPVPAPGGTRPSVAVNVTDWPNTVVFVEEVTVAVLSALMMVCDRADEVFVLKLLSPLYTAVRECDPAERSELVK